MTVSLKGLQDQINALTYPSVIISTGLSGSNTLGLVYYPNDSGVLTLADKDTDTRERIHGIGTGNAGEMIIWGEVTGLSSLTAGEMYYLGDNGAITVTAPTAGGDMVLRVGQAITTTTLAVQFNDPILL